MNRELWVTYRKTWEEFSRKLYELQELADSGQPCDASKLLLAEVKQARYEHNAARDRLAAQLAPSKAFDKSAEKASHERENSIRVTARLLWEFSGKPQNSAESDWHRAEKLVQAASV